MINIHPVRDRLNAISPSFCLAKWYQVTIHLQNGHTHSCHHPQTHKVSLEEIAANPSALHNTAYKKQRRKEMLEGIRPPECQYCWNVEDAPGDNISDRHLKSADWWALPHFDEARTMPWDADVNPTYVEVSFGNVCNFKCSYCAPHISSKWMEEIKRFGAYPTSMPFNALGWVEQRGLMPIPEREENPYVEAFWKWWPDLYRTLKVFRITGGEPLLNKNTFRVLDYILENPNPDLSISINSNLGIPDALYDEFLAKIAEITRRKCLRSIDLYTSVDAHGRRAEYIRHGLDYEQWKRNVEKWFQSVPEWRLVVMSTFNALSVTSFLQMYRDLLEFRKAFRSSQNRSRIAVDFPYLRHPEHQNVMILTAEYAEMVNQTQQFVKTMPDAEPLERTKLERIYHMMLNPWPEAKLLTARADFYRFFSEHDRRRGTDFVATFPEMREFWNLCKQVANV